MSLSLYKEKRKFEETPEPEGTEKFSQGSLRFVIQKHDASHLHYDFRLEMQGVLKSWAVPKGPSLNPSDKRLAMIVEDHPYDYRTFEGIIPAGNYGGGTVMVWDEGTFQPEGGEDLSLKEQEKLLLSKFHSGDLKIVLHGKKIKGSYALVKLKRDEKSWLLIKHKDKYAGEEDITQKNKSVVSKKTLAQIAKENGTELNHPEDPTSGVKKGAGAAKKATKKNPTLIKESKKEQTNDSIKKAPAKTKKIKTSGIILEWDEEKDQEIIIEKIKLSVTSLDKIYWKKENLTKGDSINYYLKIAPYILPYMVDRPQSLNRHPNGIDALNFFQKDMKGNIPEWLETHKDFSESTNQDVHYMICANEASLIFMANLGCIEMNPWHSRSLSWQKPDWCLIDLDPDTTNTFEQVIETAQLVKKVLDSIGAESCVKTSGSSGIHIYIPLGAQYDYEQSKQLAQLVVTLVQAELPELTSLERSPAKRKGKIYLDFLQNRETQTAAAPYSLRPKREAPVSTPLHWDEVKKGLTSTTYTMKNIFERLKAEGDLFQPVLGKGINIEKVLKNLDSIAS
jgi:bifunctional non-homologous end joining protein LigD